MEVEVTTVMAGTQTARTVALASNLPKVTSIDITIVITTIVAIMAEAGQTLRNTAMVNPHLGTRTTEVGS